MRLNGVLILIEHLYLSGMWLGEVQGQMPKRHVFERDWIPCSEYYNCSRLNFQHNAGMTINEHENS